jgi:hypothetical protein
MRMSHFYRTAAALILVACAFLVWDDPVICAGGPIAPVPVQSSDSVVKKLTGFWKLESFERVGADGQVSYPFGREAIGYIMYDSTGHMGVHIMRAGRQRPEGSRAVEGYMAYFGKYEVIEKEGVVIHHMEGNTNPNLTGTDYVRYYDFEGDRLILTPTNRVDGKLTPRSPNAGRLTWRRVK